MTSFLRTVFRGIYELLEVFVLSASVFFVFYIFLGQPHKVSGVSMMPNFLDGEFVLTDKVTYRQRLPQYGDVVVFKAPVNENYDFIKRVIAVAGQTVAIRGGKVFVNNVQLNESTYIADSVKTLAEQFLKEGEVFTVPAGTIFVLGDNREHSSDSRDWGPVPLQNIVGRAFFVYWPPKQSGLVKNPVQ